VHRVRDEFLAGPRLAADEHRGIGRCDHLDLREHVSKGGALADNARADFVVRSDLGQRNVPVDRLMARADPRDCESLESVGFGKRSDVGVHAHNAS
jgi:hypothetical protein